MLTVENLKKLNNLHPLTMDSFAWRQVVTEPEGQFLIPPHNDPTVWEFPIDFIFQTQQEAQDWLHEYIYDYGNEPEAAKEEVADWILVRLHTRIVKSGKDIDLERNEERLP